jgi:hypothetical protein
VTDLSLKSVAAWGKAMGLSEMTPTAFFFRVRDPVSRIATMEPNEDRHNGATRGSA